MKKILNFFNEPEGKVSFARLTGFLLVIYYICLGVYVAIKKKEILDIPFNLTILVLSLYGINKIERIFNNKRSRNG